MGVSGMTEEPKRQEKEAQESEENSRGDKMKEYFFDNPTLALTLLYLYVTATGMLYSVVLYGSFGINILDYSEIIDFLLAGFKVPTILISTALSFPLIYLIAYITDKMIKKLRELSKPERGRDSEELRRYFRGVMWKTALVVGAVVNLGFTGLTAADTASSIKNGRYPTFGHNPTVEVRYRSFSGSAGQVTVSGLVFIGATQRAAFFYDEDHKRTIVIPQSQLVSIEVPEQD
jgi:hypothetical protein